MYNLFLIIMVVQLYFVFLNTRILFYSFVRAQKALQRYNFFLICATLIAYFLILYFRLYILFPSLKP